MKNLGEAVDTEFLNRPSGIGTIDLSRRDAALNYFNIRSLAEAANAQSQEQEKVVETAGLDLLWQALQIRSGEESKPPLPSPPAELLKRQELEAPRQVMLIKDDRSRRRSHSFDDKRHPAGEYGDASRIDSVPLS